LQLEQFRLQSLHIECNPEWLAQETLGPDLMEDYEIIPDFSIFERSSDSEDHCAPGQVMVRLSLHCEPADSDRLTRFSQIHVEVWGLFSLAHDTPAEHITQLKDRNSVAILHGIARGQVMQATGTCADGPFIMPSLNYAAQRILEETEHRGGEDVGPVEPLASPEDQQSSEERN